MMQSKRKLNPLVENSNTCLNLQVLTNSKDKTRRERILRNHMASHVIAAWEGRWKGSEIAHDPCMYCCSSMRRTGCTVEIVGSKVKPECKFQHVPEFPQKSLKSSKIFQRLISQCDVRDVAAQVQSQRRCSSQNTTCSVTIKKYMV